MADLEPDVGDLQRLGRVLGDRREAAERALAVALLLEDEAEAVADLAPLLEGGVDLEDEELIENLRRWGGGSVSCTPNKTKQNAVAASVADTA